MHNERSSGLTKQPQPGDDGGEEQVGLVWPNGSSYDPRMGREAAKLLAEALKLPAQDRAAVAGQLLRSLDEQVDEDAEAAWIEEIGRRVRELDAGAEAVSWSQARDRIASDDPKG